MRRRPMRLGEISRVMDRDQASELVGGLVPEVPRTDLDECLLVDADTGDPVLIYAPYRGDVATLRHAVRAVKWSRTTRGSTGITNVSKTFGMATRAPTLQREACRPTELMWDQPAIHTVLEHAGDLVQAEVEKHLPEIAAADRETLSGVAAEWRIGEDTIWTSGIVNLTSALPYHRDGLNFPTWSAMPVVRRGIGGGYLHLPEYGMTFPCRDGWVCYFKGQELVHGVTPIRRRQKDGYRISVVFYSLRGMKDCATFAREVGRARDMRTAREARMLRDG